MLLRKWGPEPQSDMKNVKSEKDGGDPLTGHQTLVPLNTVIFDKGVGEEIVFVTHICRPSRNLNPKLIPRR